MKRSSIGLLAAVVAGFGAGSIAGAQQPDMQAVQRWGSARVIYYTVEGVYSGEAPVTARMGGVADVVDRVSMTFEWSLSESKLLKITSLKNYPSEVKKLHDREPKCNPPVLKGAFELATFLEVVNGLGGALDMKIERSYPVVEVAQFCTASRKSVPAEKTTSVESMAVPSPVIMAMGAPPTEKLSYSADKKSMIVKNGGWTWTFTPSLTPAGK
jgi:hypothetical protein